MYIIADNSQPKIHQWSIFRSSVIVALGLVGDATGCFFFASHSEPSLVFSYPVILSVWGIAMKTAGLKQQTYPEKTEEKNCSTLVSCQVDWLVPLSSSVMGRRVFLFRQILKEMHDSSTILNTFKGKVFFKRMCKEYCHVQCRSNYWVNAWHGGVK